ncbi:MAG TPA: cation:dicarboxylase symporter family transporter [Gemmatimonadaceae bacterium]|nr:cation:dicarboxylase symporter family transporter [Gemmatimonadaceae bacterium]
MTENSPPAGWSRHVTVLALIALVAGFCLGALARETGSPWLLAIGVVAKPAGTLWTNTLRMIVLPMMISYLILAISSLPKGKTAGILGATALVSFITMLGLTGLLSALGTPSLLSFLPIAHADVATFAANAAPAATAATQGAAPTTGQWGLSLVPTNLVKAAVEENYLAIVIAAVLFAAAMTQIKPDRKALLVSAFQAIADTAGVLVGWLISLLPIAAFALAFVSGADKGLTVAGNVGVFILASCGILIEMTLLMYPLAMFVGRVPLRSFAAAAAPAQTVAAGTRSSLASLPALLEGAERGLNMRPEVAAFVLPLSVSSFKLNLALTQPFNLLFISSMFGMHLTPAFMLTFTATMILLSFTTAGIPSGGAFVSLPFYMALGIPVEAFTLFKVADAVPDIFKTILNVTADMTVATIVARFVTARPPAAEPLLESSRLATES